MDKVMAYLLMTVYSLILNIGKGVGSELRRMLDKTYLSTVA